MPVYGIYRMILEIVGHDQTGSLFKRITAGFGSILQYATAIVGAMIFERIASGIAQMAGATFEAVAFMQQLDLALTQLAARELVQTGVATSINDAWARATVIGDRLVTTLQDMAILSPYTVESVTQTYKMAMAFGFTTEQAMILTDALLKNAAGIGADNSMLDRMAYNLAQVRLQGKVTALDIRQLALAGFDLMSVLKYVGKEMGVEIKTHLDFNEAINSGKITWEDFTKGFAKYADENFGGASERMARTLMGLKSTFHDVFVLTMPMLLGPAAQSITDFLNEILNLFIGFRKSGKLEAASVGIKEWVDRVLGALRLFMEPGFDPAKNWANLINQLFTRTDGNRIVATVTSVWNTINAVWRTGVAIVAEVVDNVKLLFGGLKTFWEQNGASISESIGKMFGGLNKAALGDQSWIDLLFVPLKGLVDWLVANGPKITEVLGKVASFFADTLMPALTTVFTFLSNNWKSIGLFFLVFKTGASVIGTVLPIIKTVGLVLATISSPITLILGAIALLVVAWTQNWGDIQGKAAEVWAFLQPILAQIVAWLQVNIPLAAQWLATVWNTVLLPAIQAVSTFWTGVLLPAILTVWTFIQTWIIPGFMMLANVFSTVVGGAISILSAIWTNVLLPVLTVIWTFVSTYLMPIWTAVADFFSTVIGVAIGVASTFFTGVLLPALQGVWDIINNYVLPIINDIVDIFGLISGIVGTVFAAFWDKVLLPPLRLVYDEFNKHVLPILTQIRDFIRDHIGPKIKWFLTDIINPLVDALQGGLKKALEWFHGILEKIKTFLSTFTIPDWLLGHSPSPFELSLIGINDQLDILASRRMPNVNAMFRGLPKVNPAGMYGTGATGGSGISVTVNIDSISNNVDVDRMAYTIARTIQRNRGDG